MNSSFRISAEYESNDKLIKNGNVKDKILKHKRWAATAQNSKSSHWCFKFEAENWGLVGIRNSCHVSISHVWDYFCQFSPFPIFGQDPWVGTNCSTHIVSDWSRRSGTAEIQVLTETGHPHSTAPQRHCCSLSLSCGNSAGGGNSIDFQQTVQRDFQQSD